MFDLSPLKGDRKKTHLVGASFSSPLEQISIQAGLNFLCSQGTNDREKVQLTNLKKHNHTDEGLILDALKVKGYNTNHAGVELFVKRYVEVLKWALLNLQPDEIDITFVLFESGKHNNNWNEDGNLNYFHCDKTSLRIMWTALGDCTDYVDNTNVVGCEYYEEDDIWLANLKPNTEVHSIPFNTLVLERGGELSLKKKVNHTEKDFVLWHRSPTSNLNQARVQCNVDIYHHQYKF